MTKLDGIIVLTNYDRGLYERELNLFPIAIYNPLSLTPEEKEVRHTNVSSR